MLLLLLLLKLLDDDPIRCRDDRLFQANVIDRLYLRLLLLLLLLMSGTLSRK